MDVKEIKNVLAKFAKERNWDKYHSPKNLAMALAGETGELIEIFQWLSEEESKKENLSESDRSLVQEELADILIYGS